MTVLKAFLILFCQKHFYAVVICFMILFIKKLIWMYVLFDLGKVKILLKEKENSSLAHIKSDINKCD